MKKQAIQLDGDVILLINQLKYKWQLKTQSAVIRRLIEIDGKIETGNNYCPDEVKNEEGS